MTEEQGLSEFYRGYIVGTLFCFTIVLAAYGTTSQDWIALGFVPVFAAFIVLFILLPKLKRKVDVIDASGGEV